MRVEARRFERAWAAHEQVGKAATPDPATLELVGLAEGLGALAAASEAAPVERAWARLAEEIDRPLLPLGRPAGTIVLKPRRPHRRAFVRTIAAAAALFAAVASMSLRAHPGSFLYPLRTGLEQTAVFFDGSLHLRIANARLGDLVEVLRNGPEAQAPSLSGKLVAERAAAKGSGQDDTNPGSGDAGSGSSDVGSGDGTATSGSGTGDAGTNGTDAGTNGSDSVPGGSDSGTSGDPSPDGGAAASGSTNPDSGRGDG